MTDTNFLAPPKETIIQNPRYQGENQNILLFLKEHRIDLQPLRGDAQRASNAFGKVIRDANMNLIKVYEKKELNYSVAYDLSVTYARKKLKQGRQWSKKLIEAIHNDYLIAYEKMSKQKEQQTHEHEQVNQEVKQELAG